MYTLLISLASVKNWCKGQNIFTQVSFYCVDFTLQTEKTLVFLLLLTFCMVSASLRHPKILCTIFLCCLFCRLLEGKSYRNLTFLYFSFFLMASVISIIYHLSVFYFYLAKFKPTLLHFISCDLSLISILSHTSAFCLLLFCLLNILLNGKL